MNLEVPAAASQEIDSLLPLGELPAGARVLDLGCGSGTISYVSFPHLRFFAIDQYAHTDTLAWPANASLVLADSEYLPWTDSAFDMAICNFVFEHFQNPGSSLRELDRVIRIGGLLYVSIPRSSSIEDRLYRFTTKGGGHLQRYDFDTFMQLMYRESRFKLEGMGAVPGAFTWLRDVPFGEQIRSLLYRSFRLWRQATGNNPLAASNFLLLFRLVERRGFKSILRVCSQCGNSSFNSSVRSGGFWKCPVCAFENMFVEL